jgi:hypothetical protein
MNASSTWLVFFLRQRDMRPIWRASPSRIPWTNFYYYTTN